MSETPDATPTADPAATSADLSSDESTPVVVEEPPLPDPATLAELFQIAETNCVNIATGTAENRKTMSLTDWRRAFATTVMATRQNMRGTLVKLAGQFPRSDIQRLAQTVEAALEPQDTYDQAIQQAVTVGLSEEETTGAEAETERQKLEAAAKRLAALQREMAKCKGIMLALVDERAQADEEALFMEEVGAESPADHTQQEIVIPAEDTPGTPAVEAKPPEEKPESRGWFGRKKKKKDS